MSTIAQEAHAMVTHLVIGTWDRCLQDMLETKVLQVTNEGASAVAEGQGVSPEAAE
jgi:hypothetical protein